MKKENNFKNLYVRIDKTSRNRFNASNRLSLHFHFSILTISLISLGLIVFALFNEFDLQTYFSKTYIAIIHLIGSIAILLYSVALNMRDFSLQAERFHRCGIELNTLKQRIYPYIEKDYKEKQYLHFNKEYDDILNRYNNHAYVDYLKTQCACEEYYKTNIIKCFFRNIETSIRYIVDFWHYIIVISLELIVFYVAIFLK